MYRLLMIALLLQPVIGCAENTAELDSGSKNTTANKARQVASESPTNLAQIKQHLQQQITQGRVEDVKKTPIAGLYEVVVDGFLIYMTPDSKYVFQGDIIERATSRNLTKWSTLASIDDSDTVVFKPKKESKYTLTIFTDIDCGYCRKLHKEVPKLTENGVKVRYMLFPRAGPESDSAKKLETVWCAKDQQQAMTAAKNGASMPFQKCANPIKKHMDIARRLGLRGTPFILTGNGSVLDGYSPADNLINILKSEAKTQNKT